MCISPLSLFVEARFREALDSHNNYIYSLENISNSPFLTTVSLSDFGLLRNLNRFEIQSFSKVVTCVPHPPKEEEDGEA